MTITDLLTTYWSQVTLIVIAIGSLIFYFIKRYIDSLSKKIEINHSLFQQNRLKALNNFFTNYSCAESMWNQLAIWEILQKKISAKEIDQIILPTLNELKKNLIELKIYFDNNDHQPFEDLVKGISSIYGQLSKLYFSPTIENEVVNKTTEFGTFKDKVLFVNNQKIDQITSIARKAYNS